MRVRVRAGVRARVRVRVRIRARVRARVRLLPRARTRTKKGTALVPPPRAPERARRVEGGSGETCSSARASWG